MLTFSHLLILLMSVNFCVAEHNIKTRSLHNEWLEVAPAAESASGIAKEDWIDLIKAWKEVEKSMKPAEAAMPTEKPAPKPTPRPTKRKPTEPSSPQTTVLPALIPIQLSALFTAAQAAPAAAEMPQMTEKPATEPAKQPMESEDKSVSESSVDSLLQFLQFWSPYLLNPASAKTTNLLAGETIPTKWYYT